MKKGRVVSHHPPPFLTTDQPQGHIDCLPADKNDPAEDCLLFDLLSQIARQTDLGNRGELPFKIIDMLL